MRDYKIIRQEIVKLNKQISKLKEQLKETCNHPKFSKEEYEEDGSARWKVFSYKCLKCGKYFRFHETQPEFDSKVEPFEYFSEGVYIDKDWEKWGGIV